MISEEVIREVIFAVQQRQALHDANGNAKEAAQFARYGESLWEALAVADGGKRSDRELKVIRQDTLDLSSPWLLDNLLPFPRSAVAYREMMKLAGRVIRVQNGKPPKRLWGLIG